MGMERDFSRGMLMWPVTFDMGKRMGMERGEGACTMTGEVLEKWQW